jgi:beta-lactamase class A
MRHGRAGLAFFAFWAGQACAAPIAAGFAPSPAKAVAPAVQQALAAQVASLEKQINGHIGVAFRLLETGETAAINVDRYPMASTYKVAIAGTLLTRIDRGEVSLDQMVAVTQQDFDETGPVADHVIHPGVSLSVANLIELMLTQSNNTATDKMLALAGGPAAVTAWLRSVGIDGIRVDRTVNDILNDFYGVPHGQPFVKTFIRPGMTDEEIERTALASHAAFEQDPRDTALPPAMVDLLARLLAGPQLKPATRDFLTGVMERCETGVRRIRGMLPAGTIVADKTGTIGGIANDVGMITLPGGRGHLLIAIYTKGSNLPETEREHAIAEIARSSFDYFAMR